MNPERYLEHKEQVWKTGRPWIIGKAAMSRNGKMTRPPGEGQWITGPEARSDVQKLRAQCDAILIGAETARQDNPKLTIREFEVTQQPWRVVVTRSGNLPQELHLFSDEHKDRTLVMTSMPWEAVWNELFTKGIRVVLVEGGGQILNELVINQWIDESIIYQAPMNLEDDELVEGDGFKRLTLTEANTEWFGPDKRTIGRVAY